MARLEATNSKINILIRGLLKVSISAFCVWLGFILLGYVLRHLAIGQLSEITGAKIVGESVDFNFDGSVFIEKLTVRPYWGQKYDDTILKAQNVHVRFGLLSLLLLRPRLKEISITDFVFDAQHDLDTGRWNISALKIKPSRAGFGKMPVIHLRKGTLKHSKVVGGQVEVGATIAIDAEFGPAEQQEKGYHFSITTPGKRGFWQSAISGFWRPGNVTIAGGINSADLPELSGLFSIEVLAAELNYDQSNNYSLKVRIQDLQCRDRSEIKSGFGGEELLEKISLFTALQKFFNRFQPRGQVDIELEARGNLQQLSESDVGGEILCKDANICDLKFAYPTEQINGTIGFTEEKLTLRNLSGRHKDVEVFFNGWLKGLGPNFQYQIQITSDNMSLDSDLHNALSERHKKLWSAFSPSGTVSINYLLSRRSRTDKKRTLVVGLAGGQAKYSQFPYPLKNLRGKLLFAGDSITISDVISEVNDFEVVFNGKVRAYGTGRPIYDVSMRAENISLSDGLFGLLPKPIEKFIRNFDAEGEINLTIDLSESVGLSWEERKFVIDCLDNRVNFKWIGYPLKNVSGRIEITKNNIKLEDIRATVADNIEVTENASTIKLDGQIALADDALGDALLQLTANDIFLDERLGVALGEGIGDFYFKLSPTGRFDLRDVKIQITKTETNKKNISFDGGLHLKNCNFKTSPAITGFDVELKPIQGSYNPQEGVGDISADVDTGGFRIGGKEIKNLRADINYDLGRESLLIEDIVGSCYGGRILANFELKQGEDFLEYQLQTGFDNVDLKGFLSETKGREGSGNKYTAGKLSGSLSLRGQVTDAFSRMGRCRLAITAMEVGRVSPLARLVQVLQLNEPKDYAFDKMVVDSYIKQDRLFFEEFDLSSESLAFTGSGWMDVESRNVDLTLTARGQRLGGSEPSILQSLAEGLGGAVVRMKISGDVYDPQVETKTLPVIDDTLSLLGTAP
jgi:hypothetical protein